MNTADRRVAAQTRCTSPVPVRRLAHALHHVIDRRPDVDLDARQQRGEIAGDEGNLAVGLGGGARRGRGLRRTDSARHLLRIERRHIGGNLGHRKRRIAGDAHEGPHAHDFAVADWAVVETRMIWRTTFGSSTAGSLSVLRGTRRAGR